MSIYYNYILTPQQRLEGYTIVAHPHALRHKDANGLIRLGLEVTEVDQHLGHGSTKYILRDTRRAWASIQARVADAFQGRA